MNTDRITCRYADCNEPATGGDQLQTDGGRMLTVNYCERHGKLWAAIPDIVNNGAGRCVISGCQSAVFSVHCCRRHYDQTRPWKMATALRFSATLPEAPMSVATTPAPDLPLCPPPAPELPPIFQPLDPGIATAVELLRAEWLSTTDSGDGYTKIDAIEAGEAENHGHVFIVVDQRMTAADIIANAKAIPWTDYGYQVPSVELLGRPACIHSGSEPDIVGVLWAPGKLHREATDDDFGPESAPPPTSGEALGEALSQLHDARRELAAITAALDADPERSPATDGNDQPISLPRRVEIALMPDGFGKSELERRITAALDQYSAPKAIGSLPVSVVGRVTATARDRREFEASRLRYREQEAAIDCLLADLGAGLEGSTLDRLLQVLPVEDRRALLELEAAEHRFELARLKARRLDPPPPERVAEYQRKLDVVEAKLCSLDYDHSPDAGKKVE